MNTCIFLYPETSFFEVNLVAYAADIFTDEADYQETVDYFKYFKYT